MKSFIKDISDEFGKADPAIAKEVEATWKEHSSVLIPKLGNFKGHLCEAVHYERLRKIDGFEVIKHPNGQKESPDIQIKFGDKTFWIEDKNCSSTSYSQIKEGKVSLRNYKHSYRNSGVNNSTANLYYERPETPGVEYILAVCLFPQTKKLEWRYALYSDLPAHSKHPGRIASALKIPIDPEPDDIWKPSIEILIKKSLDTQKNVC
jgi:hypothetical protein